MNRFYQVLFCLGLICWEGDFILKMLILKHLVQIQKEPKNLPTQLEINEAFVADTTKERVVQR